ncbi:MAG: pyridoxamine 5'-phosphate oxidase family protein [Microscillaceae bacterium]|nr:pyridoxamine 5'-phosphate oxidase family protein [Microscillaceae bacterium]
MNYAKTAFSEAVKKLQEKYGSRPNYAKMEKMGEQPGLGYAEIQFISERDGFYLSSIGENGFPYIQFRGGPKGFLKVLDQETIAFLDFRGNMQFISTGNISQNNKVALFLMDYAQRTRLKIFAEAEIQDIKDNPELAEELSLENYRAKPERIMLLKVKAFDWNCPQHITPKYTLEEFEFAFETQQKYIQELEAKLKAAGN